MGTKQEKEIFKQFQHPRQTQQRTSHELTPVARADRGNSMTFSSFAGFEAENIIAEKSQRQVDIKIQVSYPAKKKKKSKRGKKPIQQHTSQS